VEGSLGFRQPTRPAWKDGVIAQDMDILNGRTGDFLTRLQAMAAEHRQPGGEPPTILRRHCHACRAKKPFRTTRALAKGWHHRTASSRALRHWCRDGWAHRRRGAWKEPRPYSVSAINASGDTAD